MSEFLSNKHLNSYYLCGMSAQMQGNSTILNVTLTMIPSEALGKSYSSVPGYLTSRYWWSNEGKPKFVISYVLRILTFKKRSDRQENDEDIF